LNSTAPANLHDDIHVSLSFECGALTIILSMLKYGSLPLVRDWSHMESNGPAEPTAPAATPAPAPQAPTEQQKSAGMRLALETLQSDNQGRALDLHLSKG